MRGFCVMTGYYDMPEATAATIDADGWLHTGDLGTMDERGYCRIQGRLKDMIIRGGENIYPREIEAVLYEHPAVADVAVVGVPDDRWGEQVAAFVRLARGRGARRRPSCRCSRVSAWRPTRRREPGSSWSRSRSPAPGRSRSSCLREQFVKGDLTPSA